jgi:uncharacterized membrane protein YoaK (UPF0700 family)
MNDVTERELLECERLSVYFQLMASAGFMGSYTYVMKGGVFCNAQTGNLLQMSIALGSGKFGNAVYYLLPMAAYLVGVIASEVLPIPVRKMGLLRWDTLLLGFEIIALVILGFVPAGAPPQISQLTINFICAMQYNTFRQAQGIPMATTFCTNHVRQMGCTLVQGLRKHDKKMLTHSLRHAQMIVTFIVGAAVGTAVCHWVGDYAIWGAAALLVIPFIDLAIADRTKERGMLHQVPRGH